MRRSIKLEGWTYGPIINPSDMSTSLPPLEILLKAIKSGTCKFVSLTPDQREEENHKYLEKVEKGEIVLHQRSQRSDKGKRRKGHKVSDTPDEENERESDSDDEEARRAQKRPRSSALSRAIISPDLDDDSS